MGTLQGKLSGLQYSSSCFLAYQSGYTTVLSMLYKFAQSHASVGVAWQALGVMGQGQGRTPPHHSLQDVCRMSARCLCSVTSPWCDSYVGGVMAKGVLCNAVAVFCMAVWCLVCLFFSQRTCQLLENGVRDSSNMGLGLQRQAFMQFAD
jgi:hypothetical protein